MAILIACGNSICGNSAIAAVAPIIGAKPGDVASSIAFTAVLGVIVVLGLPLLVPILELSLTQYGTLAGLTVYAVPQVLAATLPIGELSNQVGTIVKLVRVLMLGPVVLGLALLAGRLRDRRRRERAPGRWPPFRELVPWFIIGFLMLALLRSLGFIPRDLVRPLRTIAAVLTTIAMAALGLGVDIRTVAKAGPRIVTAVTASLVVLGVISFALIRLAGYCVRRGVSPPTTSSQGNLSTHSLPVSVTMKVWPRKMPNWPSAVIGFGSAMNTMPGLNTCSNGSASTWSQNTCGPSVIRSMPCAWIGRDCTPCWRKNFPGLADRLERIARLDRGRHLLEARAA